MEDIIMESINFIVSLFWLSVSLLMMYVSGKLLIFIIKIIILLSSYFPPKPPYTFAPGVDPYPIIRHYERNRRKYEQLKNKRKLDKQNNNIGLVKRLTNEYHDMFGNHSN